MTKTGYFTLKKRVEIKKGMVKVAKPCLQVTGNKKSDKNEKV